MPGGLSRLLRRRGMLPVLVACIFVILGGSVAVAAVVATQPASTNPQNTVLPVIKGDFQEGSLIHVTTGTWTPSAGSTGPLTYIYGFYLCNSAHPYPNCTFLGDRFGPTYRLKGGQVGGTIVASVRAAQPNGHWAIVRTAQYPTSGTVLPLAPRNIEHPTIGGTARDGNTLRILHSYWHSPDHLSYKYKWEACGTSGARCTTIAGATGLTFKLSHKYFGQFLTTLVTATDVSMSAPYQAANTGQATAPERGPVKAPPRPINTTRPTITGTLTVGKLLHAHRGTWASVDLGFLKFTYTWERCLALGGGGHAFDCTVVPHATNPEYKLTNADLHDWIVVNVTATDPEAQHHAVASQPDGPVT